MNLDVPIGITTSNYMKTVYETSSNLDIMAIFISDIIAKTHLVSLYLRLMINNH